MLFGGIKGFSMFHPGHVADNHDIPLVYITNFEIFNKRILPDDSSEILKKHISETDQIKLSYKESVLTFEFAALNYILPEKNQYAYKLEGFEKMWNYVGSKHSATYTNLDPGEYVFRVKASNNDGTWNEEGASLKLIITPPFWLTWWFRSLCVLFVILSFAVFYKIKTNTIKKQRKELQRLVLERTKRLERITEQEQTARKEAEEER